jgi:cysteine synthase B
MTDQFSNPANPEAHYETTGPEILKDFPYDRIDYVVIGTGTGGTIMGVAKRVREKFPEAKIIGVEPPPDDAIQGLRCLEEYIPPILDVRAINVRAKVTSQQAIQGVQMLLRKEGIFAGFSAGAVAYETVRLARELDGGNIVCILADGGWKYLSMDFWKAPEE